MPTYSADILPSSTGIKLGSASQAWDIYAQNITIISSGSLTLPSGLNISTSGTLTSTGGAVTGVTLVSTVATGTAPLTVASTTAVTNLNASLLLGSTWAIPGSIGATTPNAGSFTTLITAGISTLVGAVTITGAMTASGAISAGTSKFTINSSGLATQYNNIALVAGGIPSAVAKVDATAQTAAITTTTLYAVPASGAGQYRLNYNAKVTTVASTGAATSTLGGLTVGWTDPDGVAQTVIVAGSNGASGQATTDSSNLTSAKLAGYSIMLNCKASTNVTYAMAYASNTANQMAYNLHIMLEAL